MNNQIKNVEKLDWKTKKFTNRQLAEILIEAIKTIFVDFKANEYRFYNLTLVKTGEMEVTYKYPRYSCNYCNKTKKYITTLVKPGEPYLRDKYDWVKSYTYSAEKVDNSKAFHFDKIDTIELSSKINFSVGWSSSSHIQYTFKISLWQLRYNHYRSEMIDNLEMFLDKLPKRTRKKLFKIAYIFQKEIGMENHNFRIFKLLSRKFNLTLKSTSFNFKFDGFEKTISTIDDRNRKINNLLRKRKCN